MEACVDLTAEGDDSPAQQLVAVETSIAEVLQLACSSAGQVHFILSPYASMQLWQLTLGIVQVEADIERLLARQTFLHAQREQLLRQQALDGRAPKADWQVLLNC